MVMLATGLGCVVVGFSGRLPPATEPSLYTQAPSFPPFRIQFEGPSSSAHKLTTYKRQRKRSELSSSSPPIGVEDSHQGQGVREGAVEPQIIGGGASVDLPPTAARTMEYLELARGGGAGCFDSLSPSPLLLRSSITHFPHRTSRIFTRPFQWLWTYSPSIRSRTRRLREKERYVVLICDMFSILGRCINTWFIT
jgi:hypothetical protein